MERADIDKEARLDELEARLAQQDHLILGLSDEAYQQQQQIGRLEIQVRHLAERLQRVAAQESPGNPSGEIPPHY